MSKSDHTSRSYADPMPALRARAGSDGWVRVLGRRHGAVFRPSGATLLVTFEQLRPTPPDDDRRTDALLFDEDGWSVLTVLSQGRTWFRDAAVFDFFDHLTDEGFFDAFERVVFTGAGVEGYAAAAFSVAAPGATVVLAAPFATLDPAEVPWETRFRADRTIAFGPRYGYAPDMIDAAERVFVISDPAEAADAMHASLFRAPHVTILPARHAGSRLGARLDAIGIMAPILRDAAGGRLTPLRFARLGRARHRDPVWRANVMRKLDMGERPWLQAVFAGSIYDLTADRVALRRLNDALARLEEAGIDPPDDRRPLPPENGRILMAGE